MEPAKFKYKVPVEFDDNYWWGLLLIPVFWIGLYLVIGGYADIFRRFRIKELGQTLLISLIGSVVIFFVLLLDDTVADYRYYYRSFVVLFGLHFIITFLLRFMLTGPHGAPCARPEVELNTMSVGGNERAIAIYQEMKACPRAPATASSAS